MSRCYALVAVWGGAPAASLQAPRCGPQVPKHVQQSDEHVLPAAVSCAAGAAPQVLRCRYRTDPRPSLLNPVHSLHAAVCRYRLTGGSKFGADYLVYPGDPTLYHAQFCVRLLPYRQPITPSMMASATRGSHQVGWACARARAAADVAGVGTRTGCLASLWRVQVLEPTAHAALVAAQARKHLLIASVTEDAEEGTAAAASAGAAPSQPARQQEQQQQGQQAAAQQGPQTGQTTEACNGSEAGPLAEQQQEAGSVQLGIRASGVGSRGERYRIHYMTIGPVEGFGG